MQNPVSSSIECIARGVLLSADNLLLCQNTKHSYFYLPGGHIEVGETASSALCRELLEETGLRVEIRHHLLTAEVIFDQQGVPRHEYTIVFHMEHSAPLPDPIPSLEPGIAFRFVTQEELAGLDFRPQSIKNWLLQYLREPSSVPHWIASNAD